MANGFWFYSILAGWSTWQWVFLNFSLNFWSFDTPDTPGCASAVIWNHCLKQVWVVPPTVPCPPGIIGLKCNSCMYISVYVWWNRTLEKKIRVKQSRTWRWNGPIWRKFQLSAILMGIHFFVPSFARPIPSYLACHCESIIIRIRA